MHFHHRATGEIETVLDGTGSGRRSLVPLLPLLPIAASVPRLRRQGGLVGAVLGRGPPLPPSPIVLPQRSAGALLRRNIPRAGGRLILPPTLPLRPTAHLCTGPTVRPILRTGSARALALIGLFRTCAGLLRPFLPITGATRPPGPALARLGADDAFDGEIGLVAVGDAFLDLGANHGGGAVGGDQVAHEQVGVVVHPFLEGGDGLGGGGYLRHEGTGADLRLGAEKIGGGGEGSHVDGTGGLHHGQGGDLVGDAFDARQGLGVEDSVLLVHYGDDDGVLDTEPLVHLLVVLDGRVVFGEVHARVGLPLEPRQPQGEDQGEGAHPQQSRPWMIHAKSV